jgi:hypothetical protein
VKVGEVPGSRGGGAGMDPAQVVDPARSSHLRHSSTSACGVRRSAVRLQPRERAAWFGSDVAPSWRAGGEQ